MLFFMTSGIYFVLSASKHSGVLFTYQALHSIHIVNDIFVYNVPCVENDKFATGVEEWIAIFANRNF